MSAQLWRRIIIEQRINEINLYNNIFFAHHEVNIQFYYHIIYINKVEHYFIMYEKYINVINKKIDDIYT